MKSVNVALLIFAAAVAPSFAAGPAWDSSGNGLLNGTYYFRQVVYISDSGGNLGGAYAYFGNIAFNGAGTYSITGATFVSDDSSGFQSNAGAATGTYSVSASGYGFLSSPIINGQNVVFLVSNHILVGSETESGYNDVFIAAPLSSSLSLSSLQGSYTVAGFSALIPGGGTAATAVDYTFPLNSDGAGHLGTVTITGESGGGTTLTQTSAAVTYKISNGAFPVTFPNNKNADFYPGQVFLYMSPDSSFVFGGSPTGFDMFVGVKNAAAGTSTPLSGLYYETGFDDNENDGLDSYYGVFNAFNQNGAGNIVSHQRILGSGSTNAEGLTFYDSYPTTIANSYQNQSATIQYTIGQNGIRIGTGIGQFLSIEVGLPYTPPSATGSVYVDPTGIVNTASSAPYTAGISPGDFITLYNGAGLSNSTVFAPPGAFPTVLGGVKVLIDSIAAPLYYVSSTQISALVPYAVSTFPIASIQVSNNGVVSNTVTMYVNQTTPGVFTSNPVGGIGVAAMLDFPASGGYFIVGTNNPAQPGDNVAVYLTGLGIPFPPNQDGALGGTSCVSGSCLVNSVAVDVGGVGVGNLAFAGLAPGLAGLYQINFQIPVLCATSTSTGCLSGAGNYALGINGEISGTGGATLSDSYADESYVPVGSGATSSVRPGLGSEPISTVKTAATGYRTLPRFNRAAAR